MEAASVYPSRNGHDTINQYLPADLLLEIFTHLNAQDNSIVDLDPIYQPFSAPKPPPGVAYKSLMRAASVCWRWRRILHSNSKFWTHIFISDSDGEALYAFLKWQINLTQKQPLHIISEGYPSSDMFSANIIGLLLGCSHRWASLNLTAPITTMESLFSSTHMPLLKSLELRAIRRNLSHHQNITSHPVLPPNMVNAPRLAHLKLHNIDALPFSLPWRQLKSVSFDTSPMSAVLPLLHDVEQLEMYWKEEHFAHAWKHPEIQLPRLHHVDLECCDPFTFLDTFPNEMLHLPSPSIATVGISFLGAVSAKELVLLKQPLIPFTLTTLHIRECYSSADKVLVTALRDLGGLQHFQIDEGGNTDVNEILDELHHDSQFLPNLQVLTLYFVRFTFEKARDMVDSRVGRTRAPVSGCPRMRTVRMVEYFGPGDTPELRRTDDLKFEDGHTSVYIAKRLYNYFV